MRCPPLQLCLPRLTAMVQTTWTWLDQTLPALTLAAAQATRWMLLLMRLDPVARPVCRRQRLHLPSALQHVCQTCSLLQCRTQRP
jgi:hypothetical protein